MTDQEHGAKLLKQVRDIADFMETDGYEEDDVDAIREAADRIEALVKENAALKKTIGQAGAQRHSEKPLGLNRRAAFRLTLVGQGLAIGFDLLRHSERSYHFVAHRSGIASQSQLKIARLVSR